MSEFGQIVGDYWWTVEKLPDGTYKYLKMLTGTPGAELEEVLSLEEVPHHVVRNRRLLAETTVASLQERLEQRLTAFRQAQNQAAG